MDDNAVLGFPFPGPVAAIEGDPRDTGVLATIRETGGYEPIAPRGRGRASVEIVAPDRPGDYAIEISLVQEGYCWFVDVEPDFVVKLSLTVVDD